MKKRATGLGHLTLRWRRFIRNDQVILTILAVVTGVSVAYGAIGFRELLAFAQTLLYGFSTEDVFTQLGRLTWWHVLLAPAVGGLAVGLALQFLMPDQRNQGIADVIEAGALHGGRMSLNLGIKAAVINAVALGAGASAGREGPMVHLGGSIAAYVARRFHLNPSLALTLLGCGVAAGVAAAFNAPIAGTFFALEVVIGHYALHAFAPVVIAGVSGTVIARIHLGDFPAFVVPDYVIGSFFEFPSFFLLGIVCAIVAIVFMRSIMFAEDMVNRTQAPIWTRPAAGGLAVGLMAIFLPQVLGVGYEATDTALKGGFGLWLLLTLIVAKTAAVAVSLGCRFGASVFSPALFVGAMTGGAFGIIAGSVFPELASTSPGFYAIVGMAAVAASVLGAPISTTLIAFELTGEFAVTIAVVVAIAVSSIITQQVAGRSFFQWQLERRGLRLRGGRIEQLARRAKRQDGKTMTEGARWFVETYIPRRQGLGKMSERTGIEYRRQLHAYVLPAIGHLLIAEVARPDIEAMLDDKIGWSKASLFTRTRALCRSMMNVFIVEGWRAEGTNPGTRITTPTEKERHRTRSELEQSAFHVALARMGDHPAVALIRFLDATGCRINEARGLKWDFVDFETSTITLPKTKTGRKVIRATGETMAIVEGSPRVGDNEYVFHGMTSGAPLAEATIRAIFHRAAKLAGVEGIKPHDLRRSFITDALAAGVPLTTVADLVGHKTIHMTARYAQANDSQVREGGEILAAARKKRRGAEIHAPEFGERRA